MIPEYEVYAIKYAQHVRATASNFLGGDAHDGTMPLDYYVWLVRGAAGCWVVDTGFGEREGTARGRRWLRSPAEGLALLGIEADAVREVIVTHLHYDHAGNNALFPNARFHLQDREMQFATGRYMAHRCLHEGYSVFDVMRMVEQVYAGRVVFHDGDAELAPGLSLHLIGGHTMGLQAVRVHTRRGWVVLASDAIHFYRNLAEARPFPVVFQVGDMLEGWQRLGALASSADHLVPGHDPLVMQRYPAPTPAQQGMVAALHLAPSA